jgi:hypothetical protein
MIGMTGHEQGVVADVGSHVEEVDWLAGGTERVGDGGEETYFMQLKGSVVEDGPVDEVGHVAGVRLAKEISVERVRFLMVGVRKRPEDSVATAKPMLVSHKSQELILHWLH